MASYDEANRILDGFFPARAKANGIVARSFPAMAAGDRVIAVAGLFPKGGRGTLDHPWTPAAGGRGGFSSGGGLVPGTAGGLQGGGPGVYTGPRTARGPLYVGPGRFVGSFGGKKTPVAELIAGDVARAAAAGVPVVDIRVWAAKLQGAGVPGETIFAAYADAGGDADLSAEQAQGDTSDFLGDFVSALEERGVSPEVIVGAYQESGGRLG